MHDSLIRELILEEMKNDLLFKEKILSEGLFDSLFNKVKSAISKKEDTTLEGLFQTVASKVEFLEKILEKIMKKIASTSSNKSEAVSNKRVEYLLRNLNEGPEQLNEIALVALLAMAKIGALKWGATMGWVKIAQWLRQISQWAAKKMHAIPDDEYEKLIDSELRNANLNKVGFDKRKELEHNSHHDLEEQAESSKKAVMFFARWKRIEHFVEKVMEGPFRGIAVTMVYISGGDPKGNDAWFVDDITKYIKAMFLIMLLCEALVHVKHIFKHLDHTKFNDVFSAIKHVVIEAEESTTAIESEGVIAAEGFITLLANQIKKKMNLIMKVYQGWDSFIASSKSSIESASLAAVPKALSNESIDRIHLHTLGKLNSRKIAIESKRKRKLSRSRKI